ncbi:hypothetical protein [Nocardia cyriacigeorgica]|uniref:hypothetical protein n=1 Tax=Nocardia cyriacigeorgica TaxID=135487 RepID=UPI0024554330|nr:hypothetical protein [Nocardia cyriacigeorgica]
MHDDGEHAFLALIGRGHRRHRHLLYRVELGKHIHSAVRVAVAGSTDRMTRVSAGQRRETSRGADGKHLAHAED